MGYYVIVHALACFLNLYAGISDFQNSALLKFDELFNL